jgi:hypothetical protein
MACGCDDKVHMSDPLSVNHEGWVRCYGTFQQSSADFHDIRCIPVLEPALWAGSLCGNPHRRCQLPCVYPPRMMVQPQQKRKKNKKN